MGTFRIPIPGAENHRPAPTPYRPAATVRLRILVVDDYPDAAETLAFLLQMDGHEVRTATDGAEAIVAAGQFQPDAVVLDIGLPGMDGYEVATRIRATERIRTARLVAMTGYAPYEFRARAKAAGFDEFLVKPVTLTTLRAALAKLPAQREGLG